MANDTVSNTDLLVGAHAPLMQAVKSGKAVTLSGVALTMEGGTPSASIIRDDDSQPVAVAHTAKEVTEWATSMVERLIEEKTRYDPTGGKDGEWGLPVLAENLSIIPSSGSRHMWRGMVADDLWAQKSARRATVKATRIKETGGFRIDATLLEASDIDTKASGVDKQAIKALNGKKAIFPSARKAASALNRAVYGPKWHTENKDARKGAAKAVMVNARTGEAAIAPARTEAQVETAAVASSVPATVTKAALIERASMIGVEAKASWTKAKIIGAIDEKMQALRDAGILD
jgi:hypothetical protein